MIELSNGKMYQVSRCGLADGHLWITINHCLTIEEALELTVCDIDYHYGEMTDTYTGFNKLVHYSAASGVLTDICLIKEDE